MCRDAPQHATGPTPGQRGHSQSSASSRYTSGVDLRFTRVVDETGAAAPGTRLTRLRSRSITRGSWPTRCRKSSHDCQTNLPSQKVALYLAFAEEEVVAAGLTELPMVDNLRFASIGVVVPPRLRRRGYGRQMFGYLRGSVVPPTVRCSPARSAPRWAARQRGSRSPGPSAAVRSRRAP